MIPAVAIMTATAAYTRRLARVVPDHLVSQGGYHGLHLVAVIIVVGAVTFVRAVIVSVPRADKSSGPVSASHFLSYDPHLGFNLLI